MLSLNKKTSKKKKIKEILDSYYETDANGKSIRKETKIESRFKNLLIQLNYNFIQEFSIKYGRRGKIKKYDFYVYEHDEYGKTKWHVLIECHGDFWHGIDYYNGTKKYVKLSKIVKKNIRNDYIKRMIAKKNEIPLLVFWEKEINYGGINLHSKFINAINYIKENIPAEMPGSVFPVYERNFIKETIEQRKRKINYKAAKEKEQSYNCYRRIYEKKN